ncbi:MAG: cob(I)yrinic acid a,c-diamide adenosyltransferase [Pirellulales bacterium]
MKIYTKTGDDGTTGLYGGGRVRKDHARVEACGAVDELNAVVGWARAEALPRVIDELLEQIQNELFDLGAELATPQPAAQGLSVVSEREIGALEAAIDRFEAGLAPLKTFILPAGTRAAAALHLGRTVCRRAERRVITLAAGTKEPVSPQIVVYLNRLSDLLFVLARAANAGAGQEDVEWRKRGG